MRSKILQKDQEQLIEIARNMTPEERLVAFFNHSRLMTQIYLPGMEYRKKQDLENLQNPPNIS